MEKQPTFPHLHVRPPIDPAMIPYLKGTQGYRPAAFVTFGMQRQTKRALARATDNAQKRFERWEASAEPYLVASIGGGYAALSNRSFPLAGALPPGQEVRELAIITEGTVAMNVGTGTIQAPDHNTMGMALYKRMRATLFGVADKYNLTFPEARTLAFIADCGDTVRRDPSLRLGTALSTTPLKYKLKMKIPFCPRNLEVPEIFSSITDQMNLPNNSITLETQGDALGAVALTSGAATMTVTDVKLYVVANQVPVMHVGPTHEWKMKGIVANVDTEPGQGVDIFVGIEEAATSAGGGVRVASWTVKRDGRPQPYQVDPVTLGQMYNDSNFTVDALASLDITTGTIPNPTGLEQSIGSQPGAQITPLIWNDGKIRAGAWQWPFWGATRQLLSQMNPGQPMACQALLWTIKPVYENSGQIVNLAATRNIQITNVDDLVVRGGNDGVVNMAFKGRFLVKNAAPARKTA